MIWDNNLLKYITMATYSEEEVVLAKLANTKSGIMGASRAHVSYMHPELSSIRLIYSYYIFRRNEY